MEETEWPVMHVWHTVLTFCNYLVIGLALLCFYSKTSFFGPRTAKYKPIWIKFCTHLLLYEIHLWDDLDCDRREGSSRPNQNSLHFIGHFSGEPGLAGVYWSKGWWRWWWQLDYWSYKSCKAPVKSSPPTNQHPVFYRPDPLPVAQPTVSKQWR